MLNRMFSLVASLALAALTTIGCSENEPFDGNSNGADVPPEGCQDLGSTCTNEGGECGDRKCHCGFWVLTDSAQCKAECPDGQQPADTCVPSKACKPNGNTCEGDSGKLTCVCGMWATDAMIEKMDCTDHSGSGGSGGGNTGGSGGSPNVGGSGGGQTAPTGWHTFHIHVKASAYHIYCQGANTAQASGSDGKLKWYQDWHSFGCDSYSGIYDCDVAVMDGAALQFQCYIENSDPSPNVGDNLLDYTCRVPVSQLVYEFRVTDDGKLVQSIPLVPNGSPQSGDGFYNCTINSD